MQVASLIELLVDLIENALNDPFVAALDHHLPRHLVNRRLLGATEGDASILLQAVFATTRSIAELLIEVIGHN